MLRNCKQLIHCEQWKKPKWWFMRLTICLVEFKFEHTIENKWVKR